MTVFEMLMGIGIADQDLIARLKKYDFRSAKGIEHRQNAILLSYVSN